MKKIFLISNILACIFIAPAKADSNMTKDEKFVQRAAKDGLLETELGRLAKNNASVSEVKMHAQHMIDDHSKAGQELSTIAIKKNISLPSSMDDRMQKKYDKLAKLSGKKFDKRYSKCMVHDHKKAICLFKRQAKRGNDSELKSWAKNKIPTLENHLAMWKATVKEVKNSD